MKDFIPNTIISLTTVLNFLYRIIKIIVLVIFAIFVALLIYSYDWSRVRNNDVYGVYYNDYDKDALHFVAILPDSTYKHVFVKNGIKKINEGKYHYTAGDIVFDDNWIIFGYPIKNCSCSTESVSVQNGVLLFDIDLEECNFIKR